MAALEKVNDQAGIRQAEALIRPLGGAFFNQLTKHLASGASSRRCVASHATSCISMAMAVKQAGCTDSCPHCTVWAYTASFCQPCLQTLTDLLELWLSRLMWSTRVIRLHQGYCIYISPSVNLSSPGIL